MQNVLSAVAFAGFLLGLLVVAWSRGRSGGPPRRQALSALIAYAVAVSFAAGLLQKDAWPFSRWPMAGGLADAEATNTRLVAVDAWGREHAIDYRAWEPISFDELNPWLHRSFIRLAPSDQRALAAALLQQAEQARGRARRGGGVGRLDRILGPLSAPFFNLHPRPWSEPAAVPAEGFLGLRLYREAWNQEQRRRDPRSVRRVLLYEHPPR